MEPSKSATMLRAMRRASTARVAAEAPSVKPRKMGAVAAGFRMGSKVANAKRKLLPAAPSNSRVIRCPCVSYRWARPSDEAAML